MPHVITSDRKLYYEYHGSELAETATPLLLVMGMAGSCAGWLALQVPEFVKKVEECEPGMMVPAGAFLAHVVILPICCPVALDAFDAGTILPGYLGEEYHKLFSLCRREEEDRFNSQIPSKDFQWYMGAV